MITDFFKKKEIKKEPDKISWVVIENIIHIDFFYSEITFQDYKVYDKLIKSLPKDVEKVILNIQRIGYLDSTGLRLFITIKEYYAPARVHIINIQPNLRKMFEILHMVDFFTLGD